MNEPTFEELREKLMGYQTRAGKLMKLMDDRKGNRALIIKGYSDLKKDLKAEYIRCNRIKTPSEGEQVFYTPGVTDCYLHMNAKVGAAPSDEMFSSLYDVDYYAGYWISAGQGYKERNR